MITSTSFLNNFVFDFNTFHSFHIKSNLNAMNLNGIPIVI